MDHKSLNRYSIRVVVAVISLSSLLGSLPTWGDGPGLIEGLYQGLEECLPSDIPEKVNAVKLADLNPTPGMAPPITNSLERFWYFNGAPAPRLSPQQETKLYYNVFPNEEFVYLPPGSKILRSSENESPLDWIYPDGITFFHRFSVNVRDSQPPVLFEMRMIKRINGRWAFGVYSPAKSGRCAGRLRLRKEPLPRPLQITVFRNSRKIEFRSHALDPRACVECHGMHTDDASKVGPYNYRFVEALEHSLDHPLFGTKP